MVSYLKHNTGLIAMGMVAFFVAYLILPGLFPTVPPEYFLWGAGAIVAGGLLIDLLSHVGKKLVEIVFMAIPAILIGSVVVFPDFMNEIGDLYTKVALIAALFYGCAAIYLFFNKEFVKGVIAVILTLWMTGIASSGPQGVGEAVARVQEEGPAAIVGNIGFGNGNADNNDEPEFVSATYNQIGNFAPVILNPGATSIRFTRFAGTQICAVRVPGVKAISILEDGTTVDGYHNDAWYMEYQNTGVTSATIIARRAAASC